MTSRPGALLACALLSIGAAGAAGISHAPVDDDALAIRDRPVMIPVLANDPGTGRTSQVGVYRAPAHGHASVAGQSVAYVPAPGFTGRDRLQYWVKTGRAFGIASVDIVVGETVVLSGAVAGLSSPATVVASVGGRTFRAPVAPDGGYSLGVVGLPADMVTLSAARDGTVLLALPGTVGRLRGEAGEDGVLTRDENAQVQLGHLGTALAYLLQLANDGRAIASEAQLEAALGAYDAASLPGMAAAIKLVADGTRPLPAGVEDTLALIGDPDAYAGFLAAVRTEDEVALADAVLAAVSDPAVLPVAAPQDFLGRRSLASPGAGGDIRTGLIEGERLELLPGGDGRFHATGPTADDGADWSFADGTLRVRPRVPGVHDFPGWTDGGIPTRVHSSIESVDYRLLVDGRASGRDLLAVSTRTRLHYPDLPDVPDAWHESGTVRLSYRDGVAGLPYAEAEVPAVRTLPVHRPEAFDPEHAGYDAGGASEHRFLADGSGQRLDDGQSFAWTLDADGSLALAYADGIRARIRRLARDGSGGEGVLATFALDGGGTRSLHALSAANDGSLAFDPAGLARAWRSSFATSQPLHDATLSDFHVVLDGPGQTGYQRSVVGTVTSQRPLRWEIESGVMVARGYRDARGWQVECTVGVDGCFVASERRWRPLSASGGRIHVLEELWMRAAAEDPLALQSQRGNAYQAQPPLAP